MTLWKRCSLIWKGNAMAWESDTKRSDGLRIHKLTTDAWVILNKGQRIEWCPCCRRTILSARAARLVADMYFPLANGSPPPEAA